MVFRGLESELPIPGAGFTCKDPTNHSEDGRSCMLQPKTEQPSQRLTGLLTEGKCPGHGVTVLLCIGSAVWGQFSTLAPHTTLHCGSAWKELTSMRRTIKQSPLSRL